jgi:hypothetical protein
MENHLQALGQIEMSGWISLAPDKIAIISRNVIAIMYHLNFFLTDLMIRK